MEVILLEKIANLGDLGDKVSVKPGFARNFLVPQGKAKPATKDNLIEFESRRAELEEMEAKRLSDAQARADQLNGKTLTIKHQAGDEGKLFGSVTAHEITEMVCANMIEITKSEVRMPEGPIRAIGEYTVQISVHMDIVVDLIVVVEPL